jgi:hypothetical protein
VRAAAVCEQPLYAATLIGRVWSEAAGSTKKAGGIKESLFLDAPALGEPVLRSELPITAFLDLP